MSVVAWGVLIQLLGAVEWKVWILVHLVHQFHTLKMADGIILQHFYDDDYSDVEMMILIVTKI